MHVDQRQANRSHASNAAVLLALVVCVLALTACGRGESGSVSFGTGGIDCELERVASTFPAGTTVRLVARIDPLPDRATVTVSKDGVPLHGPDTVDLDGTVRCIYGDLPDLETGHYEFSVTNPDSKMPALTGGFEVTP